MNRMIERPQGLPSETTLIRTGHGNLYVNVTFRDGRPFEVFIYPRESTRCEHANTEAIGRLASLILRHGADIEQVIDSLKGGQTCCPHPNNGAPTQSMPDAVGSVLKHYMPEMGKEDEHDTEATLG